MIDRQLLCDLLDRSEERFLDSFHQMTLEEANTMPDPLIKSVSWLIWHTAKMLDQQVSELKGEEALYFSQGWVDRFAFDLPRDTEEWKHRPEEARKVIIKDKDLLIDYLKVTFNLSKTYLSQLDFNSLDEIIDRSCNPPVTRAVRLVSTIDDALMHSGQAVYTRRLVLGK